MTMRNVIATVLQLVGVLSVVACTTYLAFTASLPTGGAVAGFWVAAVGYAAAPDR